MIKPTVPAPETAMSRREAPETPAAISGAVRRWVAGTALFVAGAIAWLVLRRLGVVPRGGVSRWVPLVLGVTPIAVLLPLWHWRERRLRRALFASRFRLCTHCAYDVSSLPPTGTCPECGRPYDAPRDVEVWAKQGAPYTEPRPHGFTPWSPDEA